MLRLTRGTVVLRGANGREREVPAMLGPTLSAHRDGFDENWKWRRGDGWVITHRATGYRISLVTFANVGTARLAVRELERIGANVWPEMTPELAKTRGIRGSSLVDALRALWDAHRGGCYRPLQGAAVAAILGRFDAAVVS